MSVGFKLATAGDEVKIWDCSNYSLVQHFTNHNDHISSLDWSHDNTCLISASRGGDKIVLNYNRGTAIQSKDLNMPKGQTCVAFNNNSKYVLSGSMDGSSCLWDLKAQKVKKNFKGNTSAVTCVVFNHNDMYTACGTEAGNIIINNLITCQTSRPLTAPNTQAIRDLQYSDFRKSMLACVSDNGATYLWDTNTRQLLHSFNGIHQAPATGVSFSPVNEMLMISVGLDKRLICYDVNGRTAIKTITADNPLTSAEFAPDGATLAIGTTRGNVFIYDLRQCSTPLNVLVGHKSSVQCIKFQHKDTVAGSGTGKQRTANLEKNLKNILDNVGSTCEKEKATSERFDEVFSPVRESTVSVGIKHETEELPEKPPHVGLHLVGHQSPATVPLSKEQSGHPRPWGNTTGLVFSPLRENGVNLPLQQHKIGTIDSVVGPMSHRRMDSHTCSGSGSVTSARTSSTNRTVQNDHTADRPLDDANLNHKVAAAAVQASTPDCLPSIRNKPLPRSPFVHSDRSSQVEGHTVSVTFVNNSNSADAESHRSNEQPTSISPNISHQASHENHFQTEFIRNMMDDALEDFRDDIHRDIQCLHIEMIRQFHIQQEEFKTTLEQHYSVNQKLQDENQRLREENDDLKKTY